MNEKTELAHNLAGKLVARGVEEKPCIMTKADAEFLKLKEGHVVKESARARSYFSHLLFSVEKKDLLFS